MKNYNWKKAKHLFKVFFLLSPFCFQGNAMANPIYFSVTGGKKIILTGATPSVGARSQAAGVEIEALETVQGLSDAYSLVFHSTGNFTFLLQDGNVLQVLDLPAIGFGALQNGETIAITREGKGKLKSSEPSIEPDSDESIIISFDPISAKPPSNVLLTSGGGGGDNLPGDPRKRPRGGRMAHGEHVLPLFNMLDHLISQGNPMLSKMPSETDRLLHIEELRYPWLYTNPTYERPNIESQVVRVFVLTPSDLSRVRLAGFVISDLADLFRVLLSGGAAPHAEILLTHLGMGLDHIKLLSRQNPHLPRHLLLAGLEAWLKGEGRDRSFGNLQEALTQINLARLSSDLEEKLTTEVDLQLGSYDESTFNCNIVDEQHYETLIDLLTPVAADYYLLAALLGIENNVLHTISEAPDKTELRVAGVINIWLQTSNVNPKKLLEALVILGRQGLAEAIAEKFSTDLVGTATGGASLDAVALDHGPLYKISSAELATLIGHHANWENLGLMLNVQPDRMDTIQMNMKINTKDIKNKSEHMMVSIIDEWKKSGTATVKELEGALADIDLVGLSENIAEEIKKFIENRKCM